MRFAVGLILVAMMVFVPFAAAAGAASAPTAGAPSPVDDMNRWEEAKKKEFYSNPESLKKLPFPKGFTINDYFKYNSAKNSLDLPGPPSLMLAKGFYDGVFDGKTFHQLRITSEGVAGVSAASQFIESPPKDSRVSWDGKRLSIEIPFKDAAGKEANKRLQLNGDSNIAISSDLTGGYTISGTFREPAVYGSANIKGVAVISTRDDTITGKKGTEVIDPATGKYMFLEDSGKLTLRDGKAGLDGAFRLDTKDRHLEVRGTGAYDHSSRHFDFSRGGKVTDLDLGVTGEQKDQSTRFTVSLKKGDMIGGNGVVIAKGQISAVSGQGARDKNQLFEDLMDIPAIKLSAEGKSLVRKAMEGQKLSPAEKNGLATQIVGQLLMTDALSLIIIENPEATFTRFKNEFSSVLSSPDPVSALDQLSTQAKTLLNAMIPNQDAVKSAFASYRDSAKSSQVPEEGALVSLFGDVKGSYLSDGGKTIEFFSADGRVSIYGNSQARQSGLSIQGYGANGKAIGTSLIIDGKGGSVDYKRISIAPTDWVEFNAASRVSLQPASKFVEPRKKGTSLEEWNRVRFNDGKFNYGRRALDLVKSSDELEDFRDIFSQDGAPNIEAIRDLQRELGVDDDGKLGKNTLAALEAAVGGPKGYVMERDSTDSDKVQQRRDDQATTSMKRSASEAYISSWLKSAYDQWVEGDDASEARYDAVVNAIKKANPGIEIDEETGEITSFPGRETGNPAGHVRSNLGSGRSDLLSKLYISDPERAAVLDSALADAHKALANPGDISLAEAVDISRRLKDASIGNSNDMAALVLGSSGETGITPESLEGFKKLLSDPARLEALIGNLQKKQGKPEAVRAEFGGADQTAQGSSVFGQLLTRMGQGLLTKIDSGSPLTRAEKEFIDLLKSDNAVSLVSKLDSAGLSGRMKDYVTAAKGSIQALHSVDTTSLTRPNQFGLLSLADSFRRMGIDSVDIPQSVSLQDAAAVGVLMNTQTREAPSAGLIPLIHLGLDKGGTMVIQSKDGIGAVAATLSPDGHTVSFQDITDMSQYNRFDKITLDLPKVLPQGILSDMSAIPSAEARQAMIKTALGMWGNNPLFSETIQTMRTVKANSEEGLDSSFKPYQPNIAALYDQGAVSATGLTRQGIRKFFGGMNEIDATKFLMPSNLKSLAERYNYDADRVLQEVHTKTKRTGTDTAIRDFVNQYRISKTGR